MTKKSHLSFVFLSLLLVAFFAMISGGCGGSSSGSGSNSTEIPTNPIAEENSAARAETVFDLDSANLTSPNSIGFDANDNGMPDFLDFYGIPQNHIDNSASDASVTAASEMPLVETAEMGVSIPSMTWLSRLRTEAEGGNVFIVTLIAGQEYTFEVSKNLTESLGSILPDISIYDPSNSYNSLDDAEEISGVTIAAYPKENPSLVCYTIKPEVSGNYIVKISNGDPYLGAYLDDSGNLAHDDEASDTGCVLFMYKERRNEAGETGYYTRFKFKIGSETTDSISSSSIVELRRMFLEIYPNYFKKVYGQGLADDDKGEGGYFDWGDFDSDYLSQRGYSDTQKENLKENGYLEDYAYVMENILAEVGVVTEYANPFTEELESSWDSMTDEEFEAYYAKNSKDLEAYIDAIAGRSLSSSSAVSTGAAQIEGWSRIDADITGIPYEPRYYMGRGAMAFTMLDPPGAVTIRLDNPTAPTDKQARLISMDAATSEDLMKLSGNVPTASDTNDAYPIDTEFYAKFIHTTSETEQLSKTSANVSLATSAFGISAGTGSTNNFKFGLTSSTLVIHYEETEKTYRELSTEALHSAWEKGQLFKAISEDFEADTSDRNAPEFITDFRNDYGDYYVSGYQYGACYDAYISITTQTSEQLSEVESKIGASLTLSKVQASADVSSSTKDTLEENKATINVRIVTSGMGKDNSAPTEVPITNSNDISAIDDVFTQLVKFRDNLKDASHRANYAPVRVQMKRWKADPTVSRMMRKKGYKSGLIPISSKQSGRIASFTTKLKSLRAYRNVVNGNSAINGTATKDIEERFNTLMTEVTSEGDNLYMTEKKADFDAKVKEVDDLIDKFKSLADRYTFYTKLVIAQKQEKETYDKLANAADGAEEASATFYANVRKMPFGEEHGGSSGYAEYAVSEYVTADIEAGKEDKKSVSKQRSKASAERLEWSNTKNEVDDGPLATITATTKDGSTDNAIFCKVWARSTNADSKDDRARKIITGAPALGKKEVGFYFRSGYSSSINWEIIGQSMKMTSADYPFTGLATK